MVVNNQAQDYESQLAEVQQQARLEELNKRLEEQKQIAATSQYAKMMKIGGEGAKQQAAAVIKKQVKRRILIWVGSILAEIFIVPPVAWVTWTIIGVVAVSGLGYWCVTTPVDCVKGLGWVGFGSLIDLITTVLKG
ncbi:MAG: hypothetical protein HY973_00385 [Candidatus Kerfeldbacteria bacterium]|nr:hypothetical protein [Candidatus Kerfeldbacteria bacterium]